MTHKDIKNYLIETVNDNKIVQAVIIDGVTDEADLEPAYAYVERLLGSRDNLDFVIPVHEKPHVISIKEVREQIVDNAYMKPYGNAYKVYLINADLLNPAGQNALLKLLEEPPAYAVFILYIRSIANILPTVKSRCTVLSLTKEDTGVAITGQAEVRVASVAGELPFMSISDFAPVVKEFLKYHNDGELSFGEMFDIMRKIYRDALILQKGIGAKRYYTNVDEIEKRLARQSEARLIRQLNALQVADKKISINVNKEVALNEMYLEMR